MNIHYFLSTYPALLQNMFARVYEVDSTGALAQVGSIEIFEKNGAGVPTVGAGHQVANELTFSGLDFVTHEVRLYTAGGTLLHRYDRTPSKNIVTVFDPIRFRIGDGGTYTPAAGTVSYINATMAGLLASEYIAIRTGYGPVINGVHILNRAGGGFDLMLAGDVFSGDPAEEWTIIMQPKAVQNIVNDSVVGKQWGPTAAIANMYLDVSSAVTYVPGHLRKLIRLAGASAEYTFGITDVPPVGYIFRFTNFGAYGVGTASPKVKFNNAALLWNNTTKTEIDIPPTGTCEFVWDGTNWNCSMYAVPAPTAISANQIFYNGTLFIGDIAESLFTITHGQNILFPYKAIVTLQSTLASHAFDNRVCFVVFGYTANNFKVSLQEIVAEYQTLTIAYYLIKI